MRYIIIIGLFLFGCKATNKTVLDGGKGTFSILIQYSGEHNTETNVLQVLHRLSSVEHFDVRPNNIGGEIEATCFDMRGMNLNTLHQELSQTAGVINVVFNPKRN